VKVNTAVNHNTVNRATRNSWESNDSEIPGITASLQSERTLLSPLYSIHKGPNLTNVSLRGLCRGLGQPLASVSVVKLKKWQPIDMTRPVNVSPCIPSQI